MEETKSKEALPGLPASWPGAWGIYKYSKQAVKLNLSTVLILSICVAVLGIMNDVLTTHSAHRMTGKLVIDIAVQVVSVLVTIALVFAYLAGIRGKKITTNETLHKITPTLFLNYIVMSIVSGFLTVLSFALLIIPGFFVAPRLSLATYFLIDKNLGPIEAIKASWHATKGNVGKVYGVVGATIAMVLLCTTILGIPFAIYFLFMYQASMVILYGFLTKNS